MESAPKDLFGLTKVAVGEYTKTMSAVRMQTTIMIAADEQFTKASARDIDSIFRVADSLGQVVDALVDIDHPIAANMLPLLMLALDGLSTADMDKVMTRLAQFVDLFGPKFRAAAGVH